MKEETIRIEDILDGVKKRWQLIVSITLAVTIIATVANFFLIKPKYQATTDIFIGKNVTNKKDEAASYNNSEIQMYQKMLKTYASLINTTDLISNAFEAAGITDISANQAKSALVVEPQTDTQIIVIKYTNTNKQLAKDVVEAITKEFIKVSPNYYDTSVNVIESVKLPTDPVSPNKKTNILIAFIFGFILGVGVSLILYMLDSTFKDKEDLEEIIGLPVIGVIPNSEKVK